MTGAPGLCSVEGCKKATRGRQTVCVMHYTRMQRHGNYEGIRPHRTLAEHFAHYTPDRPDGACWLWQGTLSGGYGVVSARQRVTAHRYSYEQAHGPIPKGMHVRHTCDNPPCVNPAHLLIGTAQDNSDDKVSRGRNSRGSARRDALLTESAVAQMRRLSAQGVGRQELARMFGCHPCTVDSAVKRRSWRHVDEEAS